MRPQEGGIIILLNSSGYLLMKFKKNDMVTILIINNERIFYKRKYVCLIRLNNINIAYYTNTFYVQSIGTQLFICIYLYLYKVPITRL